jgi:hypothetical protein
MPGAVLKDIVCSVTGLVTDLVGSVDLDPQTGRKQMKKILI